MSTMMAAPGAPGPAGALAAPPSSILSQPGLLAAKIKQLAQRMTELRQEGATEETNSEFANIIRALGLLQTQLKAAAHMSSANGSATSNGVVENDTPHVTLTTFSPAQQAMLRCQIYAFKMLSRNIPLTNTLLEAISDPQIALKLVENDGARLSGDPSKAEVEDLADIDEDQTPETSAIYPYNAYREPLEALKEAGIPSQMQISGQRRAAMLPTLLPKGLDPYTLRDERNRIIGARIQQRIRELEELPALISDTPIDGRASQKVRALIELKSLRLLAKQKSLRESVVRGMTQATALSLTADRHAFRRSRKPSITDARAVELMERKQKQERDRRMRQKHLDRLQAVASHGDDLRAAHLAHTSVVQRLGKTVQKYHLDTEREEARRLERVSKERLRALKADDEEAYLKLIDKTKDTRITHLLRQTDSYLDGLSQAVIAQQNDAAVAEKKAAEPTDESQFGANPIAVDGKVEETRTDYYNVAHAIKETVTAQPQMLVGGQLKEYQLKGLQWMISLYNNRLNGILADEMGLGKTIQSIALICYLIEIKKLNGPFLIIVPLSTMTNWEVEFSRWAPSVLVVPYKGSPNQRRMQANRLRPGHYHVVLTTYEYIIKDRPVLSKIRWAHMIIDEGQRMKNTQSKLSQTIAQFYFSRYRLILTGTPLQNNLPELWALLNFVLPKVFNSVKTFDEWFNTPFANTGGQEKMELNEEEALLVIRRLHRVLRPFLLRRLKKDVEADLPDKVERIIKCKMSALQIRLYRQVKDFNVLLAEDGLKKGGHVQGLNNQLMQLRKICNHPFVFRPVEETIQMHLGGGETLLHRVSGKIELLDRILPKLFNTGHRVLMFFQMTHVMDIVQDWLRWRGIKNLRLDGAVSQEIRGELLRQFNETDSSYNIFLLSTRAGGLGLNLQTADTVIIYDSDWNPHQDLQAQDRAHRIGQKKEVRIFRLVTSQSVEETILSRSRTKLDMDKKIIQGGRFDNKSTEKERDAFLRAILEAQGDAGEEDEEMGDEELNSILARGDHEMDIFQRMDEEREAAELADWQARGGRGAPPSRLMVDTELPDIYRRDPVINRRQKNDESELQFDETTGRRKRKNRTDIIYDDGLTEDQFARLIDDEEIDIDEGLAAARLKRRLRTELDIDSAESETDSLDTRRKRGQQSMGASVEPSINGDDERDAKRRRMGGPPKNPLKALYKRILEEVQNLENPEGYPTSSLFIDLPARQDYPDYYFIVKKPISMKQIKGRVDNNRYSGLEAFRADWHLMAQNAAIYNEPTSNVVRDANAIVQLVETMLASASQPESNGASTAGNTMSYPTPTAQSEASTPGPQAPLRIKLGSRVVVDDQSSGSDSE